MNEIEYVAVAQDISESGFTWGRTAWGFVNEQIRFALHPDKYNGMMHVVMITGDSIPHDASSFYMTRTDLHVNLTALAQILPPF